MTDDSPSPCQPQEEPELQIENPNPTQDDENQNQQQKQCPPQSPQTQTLETSDPQNPEQSELNQTQIQPQEEEHEDPPQVLDQKGDRHHHQEPEDHPEQSGIMCLSPPPPPTLIPPITDSHDSNLPPLTSPANPPRRPGKRKKGAKKKQQAIEKKIQTLTSNLKPIPFVPSKTLDFDKHEKLLKRLGLWDFVHVEFDRNIRVDLIAQLIGNYDSRVRGSYVNEFKIAVNRADLGRAFNMPVKKDKGNVAALSLEDSDLDFEALSEESIAFIEDFVSNWVLLHEDTWMMPTEVLNWTRVIKDGHPEKVDWAGLIWFMVEKELMQGQQLEDCYYASHLQYLMKLQREEVFWEEPKVEAEVEEVKDEEDGGEVKEEEDAGELKMDGSDVKEEEDDGEVKMVGSDDFCGQEPQDNVMVEEPNIELTLGQDIVEKEEVKDGNMMDIEESKEEDQGQWLLDGKNSVGDHFLQRCSFEPDRVMDADEERKLEEEREDIDDEDDEEEEEAEDDRFDLMSKGHTLESDMLTGNLLQGMETTHIPFGLPGHLGDQSNMEILRTEAPTTSGGPSIFGNGSKREIGHEHDIWHESLNGTNKRLRTDGPWSHKASDFEMCMEQMQHWMGKARMMYQAKEQAFEELDMNHQFLLSEVQRREHVIEHMHKNKCEELQKKDGEIYRLERELHIMSNLLEGYRKALKETQKAFTVYRQQCQLPEEPLYKDAGPGGIVLSTMELEKQRLKREEEDRLNQIMIEQKVKEFEEEFVGKLEAHFNEVQILDRRLVDFEHEVKLLKELSAKPKVSETAECASNE